MCILIRLVLGVVGCVVVMVKVGRSRAVGRGGWTR